MKLIKSRQESEKEVYKKGVKLHQFCFLSVCHVYFIKNHQKTCENKVCFDLSSAVEQIFQEFLLIDSNGNVSIESSKDEISFLKKCA
jgi:hypothetical protein